MVLTKKKCSTKECDVLIVGAGVIGLFTALLLRKAGLRVFVVDEKAFAPGNKQKTKAFALSFASVELLKSEGVWAKVAKSVVPIKKICVTKTRSLRFFFFDPQKIGVGEVGFMVEESILHEVLLKCVMKEKSIVCRGERVESISFLPDDVEVVLKNNELLKAALVIGADGAGSYVRKKMGIGVYHFSYSQKALVFTLRHTKSHNFCAFEHFSSKGPLAFLPIKKFETAVIWSLSEHDAQKFCRDPQVLLHAIIHHFGWGFGDLELTSHVHSFPLFFTAPEDCFRQRCVLIGDAAHGLHPVVGQGLNLGLRDAFVLTQQILHFKKLGIAFYDKSALADYAGQRFADSFSMALMTHIFGSKMINRQSDLLWFLGRSFFPFVQKHVLRHAMGIGINSALDALCDSNSNAGTRTC